MKRFLTLFAAITLCIAYDLFGRLGFGMAPLRLGVTLTSAEVLQDVIDSFKIRVPALLRLGTDFKRTPLKLNQQVIAHIPTLPTASTYDSSTGYSNGAQEARGLLTDLPITPTVHATCPLLWKHIYNIQDKKNEYAKVISNAGYVLGKQVVDYMLALATSRNFSQFSIFADADADADMLNNVCGDMNAVGAMNIGRTMLVNTAVAGVLGVDSRVTSKDYAGQIQGADSYRRWHGIYGFEEIMEYPSLPANNGATITLAASADSDDIVDTAAAHGFVAGDRIEFLTLSGGSGLAVNTPYYVISTSLAAQTFKISLTAGGSALSFGSDISAGTVRLAENLSAFAFDPRALGIVAGPPEDFGQALAAQLGIPQVMGYEVITDDETGITMAAVSWQAAGTGDLYWTPTLVYGGVAGRQASTSAAGTLTDYAGHRVSIR